MPVPSILDDILKGDKGGKQPAKQTTTPVEQQPQSSGSILDEVMSAPVKKKVGGEEPSNIPSQSGSQTGQSGSVSPTTTNNPPDNPYNEIKGSIVDRLAKQAGYNVPTDRQAAEGTATTLPTTTKQQLQTEANKQASSLKELARNPTGQNLKKVSQNVDQQKQAELSNKFYNGNLDEGDINELVQSNPFLRNLQVNNTLLTNSEIAKGVNDKTKNLADAAKVINMNAYNYAFNVKDLDDQINSATKGLFEANGNESGTIWVNPASTNLKPLGNPVDGLIQVNTGEYKKEQQANLEDLNRRKEFIQKDFTTNVYDPHVEKVSQDIIRQIENEKGQDAKFLDPSWLAAEVDKRVRQLKDPILMAKNGIDANAEKPLFNSFSEGAALSQGSNEDYVIVRDKNGNQHSFKNDENLDVFNQVTAHFNIEKPLKEAAQKSVDAFLQLPANKKFAPLVENQQKINDYFSNTNFKNYEANIKALTDASAQFANQQWQERLQNMPEYKNAIAQMASEIKSGSKTPEEATEYLNKFVQSDPAFKNVNLVRDQKIAALIKNADNQRAQYVMNGLKGISPELMWTADGVTVKGATPKETAEFRDKLSKTYVDASHKALDDLQKGQEGAATAVTGLLASRYGNVAVAGALGARTGSNNLLESLARYYDLKDLRNYYTGVNSDDFFAKSEFVKNASQFQGLQSLVNPAYYAYNAGQSLPYMLPGIAVGAATGGTGTGMVIGGFVSGNLETVQNMWDTYNQLIKTGRDKNGIPITNNAAAQAAAQDASSELVPNIILSNIEFGALARGLKPEVKALKTAIGKEILGGITNLAETGLAEGTQEVIQGGFQYNAQQAGEGKPQLDMYDYLQSEDARQNFFGGLAGGIGFGAYGAGKRIATANQTYNNWQKVLQTAQNNYQGFNDNVMRSYAIAQEMNGNGSEFRDALRLRIANNDFKDTPEGDLLKNTLAYSTSLQAAVKELNVNRANVNGIAAAHNLAASDEARVKAEQNKNNPALQKLYTKKANEYQANADAILSGQTSKVQYITNNDGHHIFLDETDAKALAENGDLERMVNEGAISGTNIKYEATKQNTAAQPSEAQPATEAPVEQAAPEAPVVPNKDELVKSAVDAAGEMNEMYRQGFLNDPENSLREIAEQLNNTPDAAATTRQVFGGKISDIALQLFPTANFQDAAQQQVEENVPRGTSDNKVQFKTSKGSTYTVEDNGSTTRNKAARPDHPGDEGLQATSQKTYYVSNEDMQKLSEIQAQGTEKKVIAETADGRIGVKYETGKDAGKFEGRTVVKFSTEPQVGMHPVEIWDDGRSHHFGNEITEITQPKIQENENNQSSSGENTQSKNTENKTGEGTQGVNEEGVLSQDQSESLGSNEATEQKPVRSLTGLSDEELDKRIEKRAKQTQVSEKQGKINDLVEKSQKFREMSKRDRAKPEGQKLLNDIREGVKEHGFKFNGEYVIDNNNKRVQKKQSDVGNKAITKDNGALLSDKSPRVQQVFKKIYANDVTPTDIDGIDGKSMSTAQINAAMDDIADGIPSVGAKQFLDGLQRMVDGDVISFKDESTANTVATVPLSTVMEGEQLQSNEPVSKGALMDWLNDQGANEYLDDPNTLQTLEEILNDYEPEPETGTEKQVPESKQETTGASTEKTKQASEKQSSKQSTTESTEGGNEKPPTGGSEVENPSSEPNAEKRVYAMKSRLLGSENTPESVKQKIRDSDKLNYEVSNQKEARQSAKAVLDEFGIEEGLQQARLGVYDGAVNSAIYAESIDRYAQLERDSDNAETKQMYADNWARIYNEYAEQANKGGKFNSQIYNFYQMSPLGFVVAAQEKYDAKREAVLQKDEKKIRSAFEDLMNDPEFKKEFEKRVEEAKKAQKENKAEKSKVAKDRVLGFLDKGKIDKNISGSFLVPPQVWNGAIDAMKKAVELGFAVKDIIQEAIDYINTNHKGAWDIERFKEEYTKELEKAYKGPQEQQFQKSNAKADEKIKKEILSKWYKKLSKLDEEKVNGVLSRALSEINETGGLEYNAFRQMYADALGLPKLDDETKAHIGKLGAQLNEVNEAAAEMGREATRENIDKYVQAVKNSEKASRELNELMGHKGITLDRFLSIMRLNTLGIANLISNPFFNIWFGPIRFLQSLVRTGLDYGLQYAGWNSKDGIHENVLYKLRGQIPGGFEGLSKSVVGLFKGESNYDYFKKAERVGIKPFSSIRALINHFKGVDKLSKAEFANAVMEGLPNMGMSATIISRALQVGDLPFRFAAERAEAESIATQLRLKGLQREAFLLNPHEEFKDRITKAGDRAVMQQDNIISDISSALTNAIKSGAEKNTAVRVTAPVLRVIGATTQPFLKIPVNSALTVFHLVVPEYSLVMGAVQAAKGNREEAINYFSKAAVGITIGYVFGQMAAAGLIGPSDDDKDKWKANSYLRDQTGVNSFNFSGTKRWLTGGDGSYQDGDIIMNLNWLGVPGAIMAIHGKKYEDLTPEQYAQNRAQESAFGGYVDDLVFRTKSSFIDGLKANALGNTANLFAAINEGGSAANNWLVSSANVFTNAFEPSFVSNLAKLNNPYKPDLSAMHTLDKLSANFKDRFFAGGGLPSQITVWGEKRTDAPKGINPWSYYFLDITKHQNVDTKDFGYNVAALYNRTKEDAVIPTKPSKKIIIKKQSFELSAKEFEEMQIMVGQQRKELVQALMSSNEYNSADDATKIDMLKKQYSAGTKLGKSQFLMAHPEYEEKANNKND